MDYGIKSNVLDEIGDLARKYNIEKVYLFGSRARGDFKERSDIDLATIGGNHAGFAIDVDEETSTLLKFDVVNLDKKISSELRESIIKEGRIIYEKV